MFVKTVSTFLLVVLTMFFVEDVLKPHWVGDSTSVSHNDLCYKDTAGHRCPMAEHGAGSAKHKEAHFGHIKFLLSRVNLHLPEFITECVFFTEYSFVLKTNLPLVPKLPPLFC